MLKIYFLDNPNYEGCECAVARTQLEASQMIYNYFVVEWNQRPEMDLPHLFREIVIPERLSRRLDKPLYLGSVHNESEVEHLVERYLGIK